MTPAKFKLADSDVISTTWAKLAKHLEERIDLLRRQNDGPLDAAQTENLRGRIAELKALLRTAEKDPPPPDLG